MSTTITRHYVLDEDGSLEDYRPLPDYRFSLQTFYCPACGGELKVDTDSNGRHTFSHLTPNPDCSDAYYLKRLSQRIFQSAFSRHSSFVLSIPFQGKCNLSDQCPNHNDSCVGTGYLSVDLKKYYSDCSVCANSDADLLLTRPADKFNSISVVSRHSVLVAPNPDFVRLILKD